MVCVCVCYQAANVFSALVITSGVKRYNDLPMQVILYRHSWNKVQHSREEYMNCYYGTPSQIFCLQNLKVTDIA